jgi:hypothetical protein
MGKHREVYIIPDSKRSRRRFRRGDKRQEADV